MEHKYETNIIITHNLIALRNSKVLLINNLAQVFFALVAPNVGV